MSPVSRLAVTAIALGALLVGATSVLASNAAPPAHDASVHQASARTNREALRAEMRKLWEDHITWTRLFMVSDIADLPDLHRTAARQPGGHR